MFNAIFLTQHDKKTVAELKHLDEIQLSDGDVDVRIDYAVLQALHSLGRAHEH